MAFPRTDPELVIWLNNFANVFETHAETLGFATADVTALRNDAAMLNHHGRRGAADLQGRPPIALGLQDADQGRPARRDRAAPPPPPPARSARRPRWSRRASPRGCAS